MIGHYIGERVALHGPDGHAVDVHVSNMIPLGCRNTETLACPFAGVDHT